VEKPITLNQMRDKCKNRKYRRFEEYLDDMRLLSKNTRDFYVDPQLHWVVQHAQLLLEAAIDAVELRKKPLILAEADLVASEPITGGPAAKQNQQLVHQVHNQRAGPPGVNPTQSKRKREKNSATVTGREDIPELQTTIQIYSESGKRWSDAFVNRISAGKIELFLENGNRSSMWLTLSSLNWRTRPTKQGARDPTRANGQANSSSPGDGLSKKKKPDPDSDVTSSVTLADLDSIRSEMFHKLEETRDELLREVTKVFERLRESLAHSQAVDETREALTALERRVLHESRSQHMAIRQFKTEFIGRAG